MSETYDDLSRGPPGISSRRAPLDLGGLTESASSAGRNTAKRFLSPSHNVLMVQPTHDGKHHIPRAKLIAAILP